MNTFKGALSSIGFVCITSSKIALYLSITSFWGLPCSRISSRRAFNSFAILIQFLFNFLINFSLLQLFFIENCMLLNKTVGTDWHGLSKLIVCSKMLSSQKHNLVKLFFVKFYWLFLPWTNQNHVIFFNKGLLLGEMGKDKRTY